MKRPLFYLVITGLMTGLIGFGGFLFYADHAFDNEWKAQWAARRETVALYVAGQIRADKDGIVAVPARLAASMPGNRAYVTDREDALFIFFPTWRGKGGNIDGYVFSSVAELTEGQNVVIARPSPQGIIESPVPIVADLGHGWYRVFYALD